MEDQQLAIHSPFEISSYDEMERMAKNVAESKMFGITTPAQAICLFAICHAEGLNWITALRRYHIIEGRPSMRADAMLADFTKAGGGVLWHVRSDELVAATWFSSVSRIDDEARTRGAKRFELLWKLSFEKDLLARSGILNELAMLARDGEETILRTYADCETKGLTLGKDGQTTKANWNSSPRQMLTARNATEGIRIVLPGLIAGIPEEEEVRDVIQSEKQAMAKRASDPKSRDREAIEAMIKQYQEELLECTHPVRKDQLIDLIEDLRAKLANLNQSPAKPLESKSALPPQTGDQTLESATSAAQGGAVREVEAEVLPKDDDKLPGIQPVAKKSDWREHRLQFIAGSYFNRPLDELSREEIRVVYNHMKKKTPKSTDADLIHEITMVTEAHRAMQKK